MKKITARSIKANKRKMSYKMEEEDEDMVDAKNLYSISHMQSSVNHFVVRIHEHIDVASNYSNLFNLFDSAGEDDEIVLDICSPGGSLDTCILIRRAMARCPAQITARIGPTCSSAAGAIALGATSFEIDGNSAMMVHHGSLGMGRMKMSDLYASATHSKNQIERFIKDVYENFLTEEEIQQVLGGREIYMDADELSDRLENLMRVRHKAVMESLNDDEDCCGDCEQDDFEYEDDDDFGGPSLERRMFRGE